MPGLMELLANLMNTVSIVLAGRNSIHTWWTGMVGCLVFAWVFYITRLYADASLQVFFIVTSLLGWLQWRGGKCATELPVSRAGKRLTLIAVVVGIAGVVAYGLLLQRFTDAYAPFVDSAILAFSIVAQVLLMQRRIETWLFWLLVNFVAVPLFISRGLYLSAVLYGFYSFNAWVSWRHWRVLLRKQVI